MDADKTVKIAARRFKNGNYLLEQGMLAASRKEFDVAYLLYSKLDMQKETAEALNNIGITFVRESMLKEAMETFERSYTLKKGYISGPNVSMFNTLHNLLGVCEKLDEDAYLKYHEEYKAMGETLGGDCLIALEKEKAVYDRIAVKQSEKGRISEEETMADKTPAELLEHLKNACKPCMAKASFAVRGIAVGTSKGFSFADNGKLVTVSGLKPAYSGSEGLNSLFTKGYVEFESSYDDMSAVIAGGKAVVDRNILAYVKKLFGALASVREDAGITINDSNFVVTSLGFKNAFGKYVEAYALNESHAPEPVSLTEEDCMMADLALSSSGYGAFKRYFVNAGKLMGDGDHTMAMAVAMAGFEQFVSMFLSRTLSDDLKASYAQEPRTLEEKLEWVKGVACYGSEDMKRAIEDAIAAASVYRSVIEDGKEASEEDARLVLKAASGAIYALKSMYGI